MRSERNAKRKLCTGKMVQVGRDSGLGEKIGSRNTWEGCTMDEVGGVGGSHGRVFGAE